MSIIASVLDRIANTATTSFLMDKKDKLARRQWERQNAYDHPAAQMARFRAAGLNPDLIYDQQNAGQGITYPESDVVSGSNFDNGLMSSVAGQRQQALTDSQIQLNESIAALNESKVGETESHSLYYQRLVQAQDILDGLRISHTELNQQKVAESLKKLGLIESQIRENDANKDWINSRRVAQDIENQHLDSKILAELGLLKAQKSNQYASAEESRHHAKVYEQQAVQMAEVTKTIAERCQYEVRQLANDAAISDAKRKEINLNMYKIAFDELKYKGWVYQDKEGDYHFTNDGAKVAGANTVVDFVGNLLGAVGNFYTHHSFTNTTNSGMVQESQTIKTDNGSSTYTRYRPPIK